MNNIMYLVGSYNCNYCISKDKDRDFCRLCSKLKDSGAFENGQKKNIKVR